MKCQTLFSWTIETVKLSSTVFVQRVLKIKTSRKTDVPLPRIFSFSTALTLKIRSRSPKPNQFSVMSQLYYP